MPPEEYSDQILQMAFELTRLLRRQAMLQHDDDHCDVNMLQLHALAMIHEHEGITMTQVAKFMKVASPSATSFVNRLVKLGWLQRATDPTNRKLVRLKLTVDGQSVLKKKMQARKQAFRRLMELISQPDQKELARILQKVLDSAQKSATL